MCNIKKIQNLLCEKNYDGALITSSIARQYLLGFKSSAGTLLITKEKAYFIIDFRYIEKARAEINFCEIILQDNLYDQLNEIIKDNSLNKICVEEKTVTIEAFEQFTTKLNCEVCGKFKLSDELEKLRMIKTQVELDKIIQAQEITDATFTHILNFIKVGMSEKEIATEIEYYMKKMGADALAFSTIGVAGVNSSLPHGVPSDNKIKNGDFLTMDFGAAVDGYCSDMTRTIGIGQLSDEQKSVYEIVLKANLMSHEAVAVGKKCSDIDKVARDYIYSNGYEGCFGHGLGHAVGLEIHENPRFSMACHDLIQENMVITIEPGIYLPEKFGVRIEDMVVIKGSGAINLTKSDKKLICL